MPRNHCSTWVQYYISLSKFLPALTNYQTICIVNRSSLSKEREKESIIISLQVKSSITFILVAFNYWILIVCGIKIERNWPLKEQVEDRYTIWRRGYWRCSIGTGNTFIHTYIYTQYILNIHVQVVKIENI